MLNVSDRDGVRVIELDHGKVNALDLELLAAIIEAFREADGQGPIVLTGAGRAFSAGVDLRRIVDGGQPYIAEFLDNLSRCFLAVFDHPAPVVAAVNGPAIAGGCVIAAACDMRVMSVGPIGLAELAVGVPFPVAALEIMRAVVGRRTHELVLTARTVAPEEALALGLVDELAEPASLLERAVTRASTLGALPPGVFFHTKEQLQRPARDRIASNPEADARMARLWTSRPVVDAISAYLDRLAQKGASSR